MLTPIPVELRAMFGAPLVLPGPGILCAGLLLAARRDPGAPDEHGGLRWGTLIVAGAIAASAVGTLAAYAVDRPAAVGWLVFVGAVWIGLGAVLAGLHARRLGRRVPSRRLARHGMAMAVVAAGSLALLVAARGAATAIGAGAPWTLLEILMRLSLLAALISAGSRARRDVRAVRKTARLLGPLFAGARA